METFKTTIYFLFVRDKKYEFTLNAKNWKRILEIAYNNKKNKTISNKKEVKLKCK
jgi:hypothetical protein